MCKSSPLRIALAAVVVMTGVIIGAGAAAASVFMNAPVRKIERYARATGDITAESLEALVAGKRDAGLAATLRRECRLRHFADYSEAYSGISTTDIFTGASLTASASHSGYIVGTIVPDRWWSDSSQGAVNLYGDTVSRDLNNLAIMPETPLREIAGIAPGEPEQIIADHDTWQRGTVSLYDIDVAVWSPCKNQRGRVARAYLYMALMYPQRSLTPTGMMLMPEGDFTLSDYWRQLLLRWAADSPPTDSETAAALRASEVQGGVNPFVILPGIEQYIWGDKRGEVYGQSSAEPGHPVPLHGTYTHSETIYFTSPHIPDDAEWEIDGKRVEATPGSSAQVSSIKASSLAQGTHRLAYTSPSTHEKGCVIIVIKP